MDQKSTSRNWTADETNMFCEILIDPINNFMVITLEKKALKKSSTKEVFEAVAEEMREALKEEPFKSRNAKNFKGPSTADKIQ